MLALVIHDDAGVECAIDTRFIARRRRHQHVFPAYLHVAQIEPRARSTVGTPLLRNLESVRALLTVRYPALEIIVINDGSSDETLAELIEAFNLEQVRVPYRPDIPTAPVRGIYRGRGTVDITVIDKENGGRADALNAGINAARYPYALCTDADVILDANCLVGAMRRVVEDRERTIAVGGNIRPLNGSRVQLGHLIKAEVPKKLVPRMQVLEYLRSFLAGRMGWDALDATLIISGAFGLFRKDVLSELGGLATDCIGEDAELVVRLHRWLGDTGRDGRVVFVSEPVAWTEAPETRAVLRRQRRRWHRGLTEILARHRGMLFRPRYGVVGWLSMPWFVAFELLAPFVEAFGFAYLALALVLVGAEELGWLAADLVNRDVMWILLSVSVLYAIVLSLTALLVEQLSFRRYSGMRNLLISIWAAVEENLGYRQLNAWWRIGGALEALRDTPAEWGNMQRRGFTQR